MLFFMFLHISSMKIRIVHESISQINSLIKSNKKFSEKNHYLIFMCLFTPFIAQNYNKIFKTRSRVLTAQHFRAHNNPFTVNKIFFGKTTNINFLCILAPFILQN